MQITVWGAGAIGGITGGALARAGRDVLLVDSHAAHVAAIRAHGLTVEDRARSWSTPVRAAVPEDVTGPLELVLLAVKSPATPAALEQVAPLLAEHGTIVSLQNGLNEELIAHAVGPGRTVGCLVNWAADWIAPGRIQFGGPGSFVIGELDGRITDRARELAALLSLAMPAGTTDNIWGCLWAKLCYASLLFATALTDETIYDVVEGPPPIQQMLVRLVAEGMAVAEASGVRLVAFDEYDPAWYRSAVSGNAAALHEAMSAVSRFYRMHTKVKTGIWRDLAVRKRKTEVDMQAGVIAAKGQALGIPTPLTDRVIAMIHELEDGRRAMAWGNLEELAALA